MDNPAPYPIHAESTVEAKSAETVAVVAGTHQSKSCCEFLSFLSLLKMEEMDLVGGDNFDDDDDDGCCCCPINRGSPSS